MVATQEAVERAAASERSALVRPKAVVICSGGMDSSTLAYDINLDHKVHMLTFDYGQRHRKEIVYAELIARHLNVPHRIADISSIRSMLSDSVLTDPGRDVPEGHYTEETMRKTIVPNRNAIMLTIAHGYAASIGAVAVYAAMHAGDHAIYPDCRPEFANAYRRMQYTAFEGMWYVNLETPYIDKTKAQIVKLGSTLGVPFKDTWSCYKGTLVHCGKCGTCVERQEAFDLAQVPDPTKYMDTTFWREEVAKRAR